jgi:hypothetical protein
MVNTRHFTPIAAAVFLSVVLMIGFNGSSAPNAGTKQTKAASIASSSVWSAAAMMERNISSVFDMPEDELWSSSSLSCPYNVSFYVYETLPANLTTHYENITRHSIHSAVENIQTEWILLHLFETSPCRTANASQADFFFVPYMHIAHCFLKDGYSQFCGQVPSSEMQQLFQSLVYLNKSPAHKARHIFIKMHDIHSTRKEMRLPQSVLLTTGPRKGPRHMPLPLFHPDPLYQPSVILRDNNESWWTRPRKYAFVAFMGGLNPRMRPKWKQPRRFRLYFDKSVKETYPPTIGGLPYLSIVMDRGTGTRRVDFYEAYRNAVLCPILPGDNCWQRRFYDVIRNGCLPVIMEWPLLNGGSRSWHAPESCPMRDTYPLAKGQLMLGRGYNNSRDDLEIDYDSFVVRAPGNLENDSNMTSMLTAMQDVLADPVELARRQRNMMAVARRFTFGVGPNAHGTHDAFADVMKTLEHFARSAG